MQAMSKKKETNDEEVTLAETVISQVFKGEQPNPSVSEPVYMYVLSEKSSEEQVEKMSNSQLIAEQHEDLEVSHIFSRSFSESKVLQNPTCYFTDVPAAH